MPKGWRIAALALAFFALVGGVTHLAMRTPEESARRPNLKRLTGTIAEGLVYQSSGEKFPRAACEACRIARKKVGLFTIGAFCTLEFDGLVVNLVAESRFPQETRRLAALDKEEGLPSDAASCRVPGEGASSHDAASRRVPEGGGAPQIDEALLDTLGLRALAQASGRRSIPGVVGVTINSFEMNRMEGDKLLPILRAARASTEGKRIVLNDVSIYQTSKPEHHDRAWLVMSPRISVEWPGGSL